MNDDSLRGEVSLLLASIAGRAKSVSYAHLMRDARTYIFSTNNYALQGELYYQEGRHALFSLDYNKAYQFGAALQRNPLELWRARGIHLLGVVAGAEGHFAAWAEFSWRVLEYTSRDCVDREFGSMALYNAAMMARELHAVEMFAVIRQQVESFPWTDATRIREFHAYACLGWAAADEGDNLAAFRFLRHAGDVAPTNAWKLTAVLDTASLMLDIDDRASCAERIAYADQLAASIDWKNAGGEIFTLLHLAELHAGTNMDAALRYWELFRQARRTVSLNVENDPRMTIIANYRQGVFEKITGQFVEAREHLRAALDQAESLGLVWRAALATRHLAEISDEPRVVEAAARYREEYRRPELASA